MLASHSFQCSSLPSVVVLFTAGLSSIAYGVIGNQFVYVSVMNCNTDSSSVFSFSLVKHLDFALKGNVETLNKNKCFL